MPAQASHKPASRRRAVMQVDARRPATVVITAAGEDRIVMSTDLMVEACRLRQAAGASFTAYVVAVYEWCKAHRDRVAQCWLTVRSGQVVVFVAPPGDRFDFALADAMTDLSVLLSRDHDDFPSDMFQVPQRELDTFVDIQRAMHVYPQQAEAAVAP